jgi:hypothetical protein
MGLLNCRPLWRGGGLSRWLTVRCALFPATNARSLDVSNCALANGTDVVHLVWLNNICQRFSLLSVN